MILFVAMLVINFVTPQAAAKQTFCSTNQPPESTLSGTPESASLGWTPSLLSNIALARKALQGTNARL